MGHLIIICISAIISLSSVKSFIPDAMFGAASPTSKFHTEMVEEALVIVARDFFTSQRPKAQPITGNSPKDVFKSYYGKDAESENFEDTLDKIKRSAASIDRDKTTKKNPPWHFDSERIIQGHKQLQRFFSEVVKLVRAEDYDTAQDVMGKALHPLQDYYSHTNWVEMGKTEPNYNLGIPGKPLGIQVAGASEQTCKDCKKDFSSRVKSGLLKVSLVGFAFGAAGGDEDNIFDCVDNVIVTDKITSGYSVNQKDDDGVAVNKPPGIGKCSHGGTLDGSSGKYAKGGLNKDSKSSLFSPHDYLHTKATPYAVNATVYWVNQIRKKVSDDKKFANFLQLLPGSSIAFVVDVSPTMKPYMDKVKSKIVSIVASYKDNPNPPIRVILTPFSRDIAGPSFIAPDAYSLIESKQMKDFEAIAKKEMSKSYTTEGRKMYEAIVKTSIASLIGGDIFAITDGYPSDESLDVFLTKTLDKRRATLHIIQADTIQARHRRHRRNIALSGARLAQVVDTTGGHILGSKAAGLSKAIELLHRHIKSEGINLFTQKGSGTREFSVNVDEGIDILTISLISYSDLTLIVKDSDENVVQKGSKGIEELKYDRLYSLTIPNPSRGPWNVTVIDTNSDNSDFYIVKVTASGEYAVTFEILELDLESEHPGLQGLGHERPRVGRDVIVAMKANDSIYPIYMECRSTDGKVLRRDNIENSHQPHTFFARSKIPKEPFFLKLFGFDGKGRRIQRSNARLVIPSTIRVTGRRHRDSPKELVPGGIYGISFAVENEGKTGFFTVTVWDSQGWVSTYAPKSLLVHDGETVWGDIHMRIPSDTSPGTASEIGIAVTGFASEDAAKVDVNQWHNTYIVSEPPS